jgi:hypothetical protein
MTPDDLAQIAAHRATLAATGSPPRDASADDAPHISDVIKAAYTPEVAALYADDDLEDTP